MYCNATVVWSIVTFYSHMINYTPIFINNVTYGYVTIVGKPTDIKKSFWQKVMCNDQLYLSPISL